MREILISVNPQWCEPIFEKIGCKTDGTPIYKKEIEVRKTKPELETPYKAFIYCTKGQPLLKTIDNAFFIDKSYKNNDNLYGLYEHVNGKVIGEFVCDEITVAECGNYVVLPKSKTMVDELDLLNYADEKTLYGWHISNLVAYDKPKELSEFKKAGFLTEEDWLAALYPNTHCHYEAWAKKFEITKPPQSWCYVERQGDK